MDAVNPVLRMGKLRNRKSEMQAGKGQGRASKQGGPAREPVPTPPKAPPHVLRAQGWVRKCDLAAAHKVKQINK